MDKRKEFRSLYNTIDSALPKACGNCESTVDLHIHHIVPLSLGGTNKLTNVVRLCEVCHSKVHGTSLNKTELIRNGVKNAQKRGVKFGRPQVDKQVVKDALHLYDLGQHSIKDIIRLTGISQGSLYKAINQRKKANAQ